MLVAALERASAREQKAERIAGRLRRQRLELVRELQQAGRKLPEIARYVLRAQGRPTDVRLLKRTANALANALHRDRVITLRDANRRGAHGPATGTSLASEETGHAAPATTSEGAKMARIIKRTVTEYLDVDKEEVDEIEEVDDLDEDENEDDEPDRPRRRASARR